MNTTTFGLIAGLGIISIDLILSGGSGSGGGIFGYVILIMTIVFVHRNFKQKGDGNLSYGKALGSGVVISLVAGVVTGIYSFVIFSVNSQQISEILNQAAYTLEGMGFEGEEFENIMNLYEQIFTPTVIGLLSVVSTLFMGFIFSLIIGLFTSKSKDELDLE